ncbi:hypothetical protein EYF80_056890 [Liparis tanakae]|uniref:Uncharacterized protein n=1 Tax=Liparis tanakae TaxID=230148 RepID=A0A4Z2EVH7_9TELE|nr:hypothetical protein EYF80_056890 [Liparis tanakae]
MRMASYNGRHRQHRAYSWPDWDKRRLDQRRLIDTHSDICSPTDAVVSKGEEEDPIRPIRAESGDRAGLSAVRSIIHSIVEDAAV